MNDSIENNIREKFEALLSTVKGIAAQDIPALGECLNLIISVNDYAMSNSHPILESVAVIRRYIERIILGDETETDFLAAGIEKLLSLGQYTESEAYNACLDMAKRNDPDTASFKSGNDQEPLNEIYDEAHQNKTEEDVQILCDFIVEAMDSLDALDFSLVTLEKKPDNQDTINAIFRIFHTIKGVSGFLELKKINELSHTTENLLDEIRQGRFKAGKKVIDIIFEAVDTLKKLILDRRTNMEAGFPWRESEIDIRKIGAKIDLLDQTSDDEEELHLGEILVMKGVVKKEDIDESLGIQKEHPDKKLGEILVEQKKVDCKEIDSALKDQKNARSQSSHQVKIDISKLDNLVDLAGELVIAQSMLKQHSQAMMGSDPKFQQFINHLSSAVSGIQKIAMSMRMVPIRSTFQKMVRLVRDLSKSAGKEIILKMSGEDTEIDRNMVEALYEPMVHMIRNSADHGLESPEERTESGKTPFGTITLRAYHKGGNIVIEIEDDGRGLNREKIIEKAISRNLIQSTDNLSEDQIYDLIFEPGFSTASSITDISGRGVGMDVVKQSIEKMRGHISISSVQGRGCTFHIHLPLTLAIIEGMIVRTGEERYIIPTMAILESFRPRQDEYKTAHGRGEMVMVRGRLIPLVRTSELFGVKADIFNPWEGIVIVLENKGERLGLLIDDVLGKDEFVIKTLGDTFKGVRGIAGGSILADGKVSLIIDVPGLFDRALEIP